MNINVAEEDADHDWTYFYYFTYQLNEHMEWKLVEEKARGIYKIQLDGESHWDYLSKIENGETKLYFSGYEIDCEIDDTE